jgi:hypothetical protein
MKEGSLWLAVLPSEATEEHQPWLVDRRKYLPVVIPVASLICNPCVFGPHQQTDTSGALTGHGADRVEMTLPATGTGSDPLVI